MKKFVLTACIAAAVGLGAAAATAQPAPTIPDTPTGKYTYYRSAVQMKIKCSMANPTQAQQDAIDEKLEALTDPNGELSPGTKLKIIDDVKWSTAAVACTSPAGKAYLDSYQNQIDVPL
jgi:hypothetical protein